MLLISHIYTATKLIDTAKPKDKSVYYLTAILPDIRYTASIKRESTHIQLPQIKNIFPKNSDDYKGYYLHLLIDEYMGEWDFLNKLKNRYPKLIQKLLKTALLNTLLEIYCLDKIKILPKITLSKKYNISYKKLGINENDFNNYRKSIQAILDNYSYESIENILLNDKNFKNIKKVQLYRKIGKFINNNSLIRNYLINKVEKTYNSFILDLEKNLAKDK